MCHLQGCGAQALPSYPVAVLQEAGEVAVCRLEANEVRVTLLLHQQEPFCIISGHCGDESLSLTLGPGFWEPFLALTMAQNFLPAGLSSRQLPLPQGEPFFQNGRIRRAPWGLFLA